MNIRDWHTNSNKLQEIISEDVAEPMSTTTTVLGLEWNKTKDTLKLAVKPEVFKMAVSSKREILRIVASVFDPCGLAAPYLLPSRLLLQELWSEKYRWDTKLRDDKVKLWEQCVLPLQFIPKVEIPRYYFENVSKGSLVSETTMDIELHCFTDASKDAYASVVCLRRVADNTTVNLVMSRTKLTPLRSRDQMTIPKLELLGVLIGTRLLGYIRRKLEMNSVTTFLWTDSQIVLRWMVSDKLLEPFVSRRITEIRAVPSIKYRYISSSDNPADLATRVQYTALPRLWLKGPSFLYQSRENWPKNSDFYHNNDYILLCNDGEQANILPATASLDLRDGETASPPDIRFSNINDEMLPTSQTARIKKVQTESFPKEIEGHSTHLTRSLGLFTDENGLLRCEGRLQNADMPYDQKFPILLPKSNAFTTEIIRKIHVDNHHVGENQTLVLLRKKYWVPQGRSQVAQVIRKCAPCVKYGGGPYKLPPMPPLPKERVQFCHLFLFTGLDYLGPLTIQENGVSQKRWCCLFTCMATRALRLEVVKSLSADEFMLCLRRFVASQGIPALIVSDNAAQFKLASEVLRSSLCQDNNVAWHFIPELAPWHGGFYERLVGLVKHCLRRTLDKHLVSDNQLITVLKEIETVINSRPLTPVGEHLDHVLTPADFLSSCSTHQLPPHTDITQSNITATKFDLIKGWKRGQRILDEFRTMFQDQYLANLRERTQLLHKQPRVLAKAVPKVGVMVQLKDDRSNTSSRAHWRVGKIIHLLPSSDSQIRTARVQLASGPTLTRSIAHLYPLELSDDPTPQEGAPATPDLTQQPSEPAGYSEEEIPPQEHDPETPDVTQLLDDPASYSEEMPSQNGPDIQTPPGLPSNSVTPVVPLADSVPQNISSEELPRPLRSTKTAALEKIRLWTQSLVSLMTISDT